MLILFIFALELMTTSLRHLGSDAVEMVIMATSNPFTALFIGLLFTAMIQSSSTTTALTVALVASGSITLESAIPIIMGANVGTTITSTIVSLGFINRKKEFKRAVAAGTYHDFFNILTVVILFPLEYYYGFLSSLSNFITHYFFETHSSSPYSSGNHLSGVFDPILDFLVKAISNGFILSVISFVLLFSSIILFRKLISNLLLADSPGRVSRFFFQNQFKSFLWGMGITAVVRSSTVTTSLVVPLVAKKIVVLPKAAPFLLGANIGTTITAFIAAILNTNSSNAISIALAHFLFNLIGVLIFFPVSPLRRIPLNLAQGLGEITLKYRLAGLVYILMTFFFIPFSLIYFNRTSAEQLEATYQQGLQGGLKKTYRIVSKMNTVTGTGEWIIYSSGKKLPAEEPEKIFRVYEQGNALFVENEMYLFNRAGTCWDGGIDNEKYSTCVQEILPESLLAGLAIDSVYVFKKSFYSPGSDTAFIRYFISIHYPLILKKETWSKDQRLMALDEIIALEKK